MENQKEQGEGFNVNEPISPWKYGGGKNDKHWNPDRWAVFSDRLATTKQKIAELKAKPYPNRKKDRLKLEADVRHLQRQLDKRAEVHSMRPKGGVR